MKLLLPLLCLVVLVEPHKVTIKSLKCVEASSGFPSLFTTLTNAGAGTVGGVVVGKVVGAASVWNWAVSTTSYWTWGLWNLGATACVASTAGVCAVPLAVGVAALATAGIAVNTIFGHYERKNRFLKDQVMIYANGKKRWPLRRGGVRMGNNDTVNIGLTIEFEDFLHINVMEFDLLKDDFLAEFNVPDSGAFFENYNFNEAFQIAVSVSTRKHLADYDLVLEFERECSEPHTCQPGADLCFDSLGTISGLRGDQFIFGDGKGDLADQNNNCQSIKNAGQCKVQEFGMKCKKTCMVCPYTRCGLWNEWTENNKECCKMSKNKGTCPVGDGDCDSDNDCAVGLECGSGNCRWRTTKFSLGGAEDCCEDPKDTTKKGIGVNDQLIIPAQNHDFAIPTSLMSCPEVLGRSQVSSVSDCVSKCQAQQGCAGFDHCTNPGGCADGVAYQQCRLRTSACFASGVGISMTAGKCPVGFCFYRVSTEVMVDKPANAVATPGFCEGFADVPHYTQNNTFLTTSGTVTECADFCESEPFCTGFDYCNDPDGCGTHTFKVCALKTIACTGRISSRSPGRCPKGWCHHVMTSSPKDKAAAVAKVYGSGAFATAGRKCATCVTLGKQPRGTIDPNAEPTDTEICVAVFENGDFSGWGVGFKPGSYNVTDLVAMGVKNDELSGVKVMEGCEVTLFEKGSFAGWSGKLTPGEYDTKAMQAMGVENDGVSSLIVVAPPTAAPTAFPTSTSTAPIVINGCSAVGVWPFVVSCSSVVALLLHVLV
jgi:hypothetical protein